MDRPLSEFVKFRGNQLVLLSLILILAGLAVGYARLVAVNRAAEVAQERRYRAMIGLQTKQIDLQNQLLTVQSVLSRAGFRLTESDAVAKAERREGLAILRLLADKYGVSRQDIRDERASIDSGRDAPQREVKEEGSRK